MYLGKTIVELHELLVNKKVTPLELTLEAIEYLKKDQTNAIEVICEKEAIEFAKSLKEPEVDNLLWGIPYACKDNFSTKDILTTGSSEILKDYIPVFDATVVKKLKEKKAVLLCKSTLDELAMGGTGTTSHKGITYNPYDDSKTYKIGGSSSGSASLTAQGIVPFSLGSDTGDSVRKPATYAGLVGLKPTWGRISRYGVFPFAPSLDHVAYFTRTVKDSAIILENIAGEDLLNDATCSTRKVEKYYSLIDGQIKGKKIAVIKEINDAIVDLDIKSKMDECINLLKKQGAIVEEVSFDKNLLQAVYPTYMIISCAEATSNNANLDGIKFGPRIGDESSYEEVMINSRTKGFGELIKRRFVIGSYSLLSSNKEELFIRAQKIRRLIVNKANEILNNYDSVLTPCSAKVKSPYEVHSDDVSNSLDINSLIIENHLAIGNFGGFPSISIPVGISDGFPFAFNFTSKIFDEVNLFNIAYALEQELGLENLSTITVKKVNN